MSKGLRSGTSTPVTQEYESKVRAFSIEKALSVAAYGESVAAYRYRTLAEKTHSDAHRTIFADMADEEQSHHIAVQKLLKEHFPGIDFVLTPEDKELVTVGPRMLEVTDRASLDRALEWLYESERLTGRFYAALHAVTPREDLRPLLKEMADECVEHAKLLKEIPSLD